MRLLAPVVLARYPSKLGRYDFTRMFSDGLSADVGLVASCSCIQIVPSALTNQSVVTTDHSLEGLHIAVLLTNNCDFGILSNLASESAVHVEENRPDKFVSQSPGIG